MPFKSEAQRRLMWAKHPEIAKKWAAEYPGQGKLPGHVAKKKKPKAAKPKKKKPAKKNTAHSRKRR